MVCGFYSAKNLEVLSSNSNTYIILVSGNTDLIKDAMKDIRYTGGSCYRHGRKHARIEHASQKISADDMAAEGIFSHFKDRWNIEIFYQYLKNKGDFNDLMVQDCYKEQV